MDKTIKKEEIKIDEDNWTEIAFWEEGGAFQVHTINWHRNSQRNTNHGERVELQTFLDKKSAEDYFDNLLKNWK